MLIEKGPHDEAFEKCCEHLQAALDTIDATIDQIEQDPAAGDDLPKPFWLARRAAVQRAYNALLGQVWIEDYRGHSEPARSALVRAEREGRTIHAWDSHLQDADDGAAIVIGSPPPISVDEACALYAKEPGRVYVTLRDADPTEGAHP